MPPISTQSHFSPMHGMAGGLFRYLKLLLHDRKRICIAFSILISANIATAQINTSNYSNRGLEDNVNPNPVNWTVAGGTAILNTNAQFRTGGRAISHAVNSTTQQRISHTGNPITVPAGHYAHLIFWTRSNNSSIRAFAGVKFGNLADNPPTSHTPSTSGWTVRASVSRQNTGLLSDIATGYVATALSSGTTSRTGYYDDFFMYTSSSITPDLTKPNVAPSCLTSSLSGTGTSINLTWTEGSDAGTGVQGTLVLRATSGSVPTLNDQGTYYGTFSGWTVIANLPAGQTYYTDNTVTAGTNYRYTVVNYDLALNYSASAVLSTITAAAPAYSPNISQSIQNVSRSSGGTFQPGDTIQLNVIVDFGSWSANGTIYNLKTRIFKDSKLDYIAGSMKIKDNKGFDFASSASIPSTTCGGTYSGTSSSNGLTDISDNNERGAYNIVGNYADILLGELPTSQTWAQLEAGTNKLWGGRVRETGNNTMTVPNYYNNRSIVVASIQARIPLTALPGEVYDFSSSTNYSFGEFADGSQLISYNINSSENANRFIQIVTTDPSVPASYSSRGANLFSLFDNGTFGGGSAVSGPASLSSSDLNKVTIATNLPNDGAYSIVKNTAGVQTQTNNNIAINSTDRVHSHWYILGDHTGAAVATDGNNAVAQADSGGYMLLVNADYAPTRVVSQTLTGLCPGTFYNFKAWFKNVCPSCGVNSNSGLNYRNAGQNSDPGRAGAKPSLTFEVNNQAYYTTGPIDTIDLWKQKEFVFATGASSGDFNFSIRNNAPGGDGNDWALDDISIVTRGPIATVNVNANPIIDPSPTAYCVGQRFQIMGNWLENTAAFTQYDSYQFQYANSPTGPWTAMDVVQELPTTNDPNNPLTGRIDSMVTPQFTVPDSDVYFRMVVATQAANISLDDAAPCQVSAYNAAIVRIGTCVLPIKLLRFNAASFGQQVHVKWAAAEIDRLVYYVVERSINGVDFEPVQQVDPKAYTTAFQYNMIDRPYTNADRIYYRLKMVHLNNEIKYSAIETVSWKKAALALSVTPNPAKENIQLNWSGVAPNQKVKLTISTLSGQVVHTQSLVINQGPTQDFRLPGIPAGLYILQVEDPATRLRQTIKLTKL